MALLETQKLTKTFIGLKAVTNLDLAVNPGQFLGLIGPNGAGKTTAFNLISGVLPVTSGKIIYKGRDITGFKPHIVARLGIIRTFQLASVSLIYLCWTISALHCIINLESGLYRHCSNCRRWSVKMKKSCVKKL